MVNKTRKIKNKVNKGGGLEDFFSESVLVNLAPTHGKMTNNSNNGINIITLFIITKFKKSYKNFPDLLNRYGKYINTANLANSILKYKNYESSLSLLELICTDPAILIEPKENDNQVIERFIKQAIIKLQQDKNKSNNICGNPNCTNVSEVLDSFFTEIIYYLKKHKQYPTIFDEKKIRTLIQLSESRNPQIPGLTEYLQDSLNIITERTSIDSGISDSNSGISDSNSEITSNSNNEITDSNSEITSSDIGITSSDSGMSDNASDGTTEEALKFLDKNYSKKDSDIPFKKGNVYYFLENNSKSGFAEGKVANRGQCSYESCPFDIKYIDNSGKEIIQYTSKNKHNNECWVKPWYKSSLFFNYPFGGKKTKKKSIKNFRKKYRKKSNKLKNNI
jgi:hypothetical protein